MEDQQHHIEYDDCVSSYTLFDILQAAPRLAELLSPQGCKTLAAACTSLRTWYRARVTVIRLTDPKDMALLQPQHWPRLVTVMMDSTSDHLKSEVDRPVVRQSLPATWTQLATVYLGANGSGGMFVRPSSLPINTIAVLVQPAGLQMLQHQDKRPHVCTLQNLVRQAAPYVTDVVITGHLGAPILEMFAWHKLRQCPSSFTMLGPCILDAEAVFYLGQFLPRSTHTLRCAHCRLTPEACSSLGNTYWSGLRMLYLFDCSIDAAAVHHLSKTVGSRLVLLDLSCNLLSGLAVKHLVSANLLSLRFFHLRGTGLNAAALETLSAGEWPYLSNLHLQGNHIDIRGIWLLLRGAWP